MKITKKQYKNKLGFLTLALSLAVNLPVYGAEDDSDYDDAAYQTSQVVITAAGFEQDVTDAPATITVITKEEINSRGYSSLSDILADVPGVDVRGSNSRLGVGNIQMRGMDSTYTLVMVDGVPQDSSRDSAPNAFYTVFSAFVPPLASIERIEVIKGPMSTLYGSDALGGVVNIITKKVTDEWKHNLTTDYTLYEDSDRGSVTRYSLYSSGPLDPGKVGLVLRGSFIRRGGSHSTDELGNELSARGSGNPSAMRNYSVGSKVTWKLDDDNSIWLDGEKATVDFSKGDSHTFEREKIQFGSDNKTSYGDWHSTVSYNTTETIGYTSSSGGSRKLKSGDLILDTRLVSQAGDSHTLTVGGRYKDQFLEDSNLADRGIGNKLHSYNTALFAEDEWRFLDNLALTYGVRYDHYNSWGDHYSPKGYLVWNPAPKWTVKGGVSTGYNAPTLAQSTPGITGSSGGGYTTIDVYGNPDLKPESSVNKELGVYYQTPKGLGLNATVFHNKFKNKIQTEDLGTINGNTARSYKNVDRAKTSGVEFGSQIPLREDLSLNLAYTYTETEQTSGDDKGAPLNNVPRHAASAKLNWKVNEKTNTWIRGEYRAKMNRYTTENYSDTEQAVVDALGKYFSSYTVCDVGASHKLSDSVTLNVAVNNIFDKDLASAVDINGTTYYKYFNGTAGTYLAGRNYWMSVNYNF